MKGIVVSVGALLALLSCGGVAQAGVAGGDSALSRAALLGRQGFVQEFISAGNVQENAPIILAKRRKKKKGARGEYVSGGGGGTIQIDPNTDELEKLMMLPLIDREEAQAIIEYRKTNRIDTPEEMTQIKGIDLSEYRIFKHLIVIREQPVATVEIQVREQKAAPPQEEQEPQKKH